MKQLIKKQLIALIPIWEEILKLRAHRDMKTISKENIPSYIAAVKEFLLEDLPYKEYFEVMRNRRASRTLGHNKTAVDQFFSFLLVCWLIDKHPDPNYKIVKWG